MKVKLTHSSGNVFRDIGFPRHEAENLLIRSNLMTRVERIIHDRGLTQSRAAKLFGVTQPRISDLVRGKIHLFSIDALVDMLSHAGVRIQIDVAPKRGQRRVA